MKSIKVNINLNGIMIQRRVLEGTTLEDILKDCQNQLPYKVMTAKVGNKMKELTWQILEPCKEIQFLDQRHRAATRVYQRSLTLLYIKSIKDVLGASTRVVIQNPLNKGLYSEVHADRDITDQDVQNVDKRMRELVAADVPFIKRKFDMKEALEIFESQKMSSTKSLLEAATHMDKITFYECDGYKDYFYGHMVPSTRYLDIFDLRKYGQGILLRYPHVKDPAGLPAYFDDKELFKMFEEAAEWGKILGISFAGDLNEKIINGELEEVIKISEALHEKKVAAIADMIQKSGKRVVLICGPSSSGKTTFANRLMIQLKVNGKHPMYIGTDDYFVERVDTPKDEFGKYNFEDIEAIDLKLFNENMNDLLAGKEVDLPTFNFFEGRKEFGKRMTTMGADQTIVIEGIHGLNRKLTANIPDEEKFKIYISPLTQLGIDDHNRISTTDGRLIRRMVRDNQFRGYDARKTLNTWADVRRGEEKNIFPFNGEADVMFNSALIYECAVLRKYAEPLLQEITPAEEIYPDAVRILKLLEHFRVVPDDVGIVNNSIIREFIGGSTFFKNH